MLYAGMSDALIFSLRDVDLYQSQYADRQHRYKLNVCVYDCSLTRCGLLMCMLLPTVEFDVIYNTSESQCMMMRDGDAIKVVKK